MGNTNEYSQIQDPSIEPLSQTVPSILSPIHIAPESLVATPSSLNFCCNSLYPAQIKVRFFVYEEGLGYVQDQRNLVSIREFSVPKGFKNNLSVELKSFYTNDYTYQDDSSLPIVIQAITENWEEATILEIRDKRPRVLQQRVIINRYMYEIREIYDAPNELSEERDRLCVICLTNFRDIISEPCCHICLCYHCASLMRTQVVRKCPICRKGNFYAEIQGFIKINNPS
jgi:Zinc finger, C3HC4 type (RING finger)